GPAAGVSSKRETNAASRTVGLAEGLTECLPTDPPRRLESGRPVWAVKRGGRMAVRVIVSIDALPGKGPELARLRSPFQADVRKEPGCEQFDLFQNTENPDK